MKQASRDGPFAADTSPAPPSRLGHSRLTSRERLILDWPLIGLVSEADFVDNNIVDGAIGDTAILRVAVKALGPGLKADISESNVKHAFRIINALTHFH